MGSELRKLPLRSISRAIVVLAAIGGVLAGCEEPVAPRNFADFTEDRIAREGTLARCNSNPEATLNDIECANARRAAAAIALRQERERREVLERESELKLAALRARLDEQQRRVEAERAAAEQAYDELWRDEQDATGASPALEPVRVPSTVAPFNGTAPRTADGPVLEEVVVPSRFGWRPAGTD